MKAGFTLIELIVGLFLASLIGVALYNSYYVTQQVVNVTNNIMDRDFRIGIIQRQLNYDLAGTFIPYSAHIAEKSKDQSTPAPTSPEATAKKPEEPKIEVAKEKPKPLKDVFIATNKKQTLDFLSFITNNPLKVYEKARNIKVKPSKVRVVYRLISDEKNKQLFTLVRQESTELDLASFDKKGAIRSYEVAGHIKNITAEFVYPEPLPEEKNKEEKEEKTNKKVQQQEKKYITLKEWKFKPQDKEKKMPQIPQFITFNIVLWDNEFRQEKTYILRYEVLTFEGQTSPEKTQEKKSSLPLLAQELTTEKLTEKPKSPPK